MVIRQKVFFWFQIGLKLISKWPSSDQSLGKWCFIVLKLPFSTPFFSMSSSRLMHGAIKRFSPFLLNFWWIKVLAWLNLAELDNFRITFTLYSRKIRLSYTKTAISLPLFCISTLQHLHQTKTKKRFFTF